MNISYETSPLKRKRSTQTEMGAMLEAVRDVLADPTEETPMTVRHMFYALVTRKVIQKSEKEYQALCRRLGVWRKAGLIPFSAFMDGTRFHFHEQDWNGLNEMLQNSVETYRKNHWLTQRYYLEVWAEKDAVSGVLASAANALGVSVFVCRGFASLSSLYNCANTFRHREREGKICRVLYFGDHDPSGIQIDRSAQATLAEDFNVYVDFRRVAVRPEHIESYDLPTRPVKDSDKRSKGWEGGCVEIDAFSSRQLRTLVSDAIQEHIDPSEWEQMKIQEQAERNTLTLWCNAIQEAGI